MDKTTHILAEKYLMLEIKKSEYYLVNIHKTIFLRNDLAEILLRQRGTNIRPELGYSNAWKLDESFLISIGCRDTVFDVAVETARPEAVAVDPKFGYGLFFIYSLNRINQADFLERLIVWFKKYQANLNKNNPGIVTDF